MLCKNYKLLLIFVFLISIISLLSATTFREVTLKELCTTSDQIVIVNTEKIHSYWTDDHSRIFTDITFKVSENIKGDLSAGQNFTITIYGGTVGEITTSVVGGPEFYPEQLCILFLSNANRPKINEKIYTLTGSTQGKFTLFTNQKNGETEVKRDLGVLPLTTEPGGQEIAFSRNTTVLLSDFIMQINKYL